MMDELRNKRESRREFIKNITRAALAACISGAGLFLVAHKRVLYTGEHTCSNRWICRGCSKLEDCILPQALSARIAQESLTRKDSTNVIITNGDPDEQ